MRIFYTLCFGIMFSLPIICLAGEEGKKQTPDVKKQERVKSEKKAAEKPAKKSLPEEQTQAAEKEPKKADDKQEANAVKRKAVEPSKEKPSKEEKASALPKATESDYVEVLDLKMAKSVKEREPVDATDTFDSGNPTCTWAKLKVKKPETSIRFRYSRNGTVMWTSKPRTVKQSPKWRTWLMSKFMKTGEWRVEILDIDENVLSSTNFSVK